MIIFNKKTLEEISLEDLKKEFIHICLPSVLNLKSFENTEIEKTYSLLEKPNDLDLKEGHLVSYEIEKLKTKFKITSKIVVRPMTLSDKNNKIEEIKEYFKNRLKLLKSNYSENEIDSWAEQKLEATNYLTNNDFSTPLLDILCKSKKIKKLDLANKILSKSKKYAQTRNELIELENNFINKIQKAVYYDDLPKLPK